MFTEIKTKQKNLYLLLKYVSTPLGVLDEYTLLP